MSAKVESPLRSADAQGESAIRAAMSLTNILTPPHGAPEGAEVAEVAAKCEAPDVPEAPEAAQEAPSTPIRAPRTPTASAGATVTVKQDGGLATPPASVATPSAAPHTPGASSTLTAPSPYGSPESAKGAVFSSPSSGANADDDPNGTDANAPPLSEREFVCMNDEYSECRTGQYSKDLSRKVISDHFGRNKACTREVSCWPLFCRKHYQRATYNADKWQLRKINLILRQFDVIESEHPGTTYNVCLKKSEEGRLNKFSRGIASGLSSEDAGAPVLPSNNKSFEAPIDVLRELEFGLGEKKTIDEVKATVTTILDMLNKGETKAVPSIEFLPQLPKKNAAPVTPKNKNKGTPTRVSAKGSVKKTTKKT